MARRKNSKDELISSIAKTLIKSSITPYKKSKRKDSFSEFSSLVSKKINKKTNKENDPLSVAVCIIMGCIYGLSQYTKETLIIIGIVAI